MKIPITLVNRYLNLSEKDVMFLIFVNLHIQGKINGARLKAAFNSLQKKTFFRHLGSHHSNIDGKWYCDMPATSMMYDIHADTQKADIDLDVMLKYLNLFLNKNKNYCLDYLYSNFIEPLIDADINSKFLEDFGFGIALKTYEWHDSHGYLDDGYCCRDCDGCLGEYKRSRYNYLYKNNNVESDIKAVLREYKTHKKNPFDNLA